MNTTPLIDYRDATVREHSLLDDTFVVSIHRSSGIWGNREMAEFASDLEAAGVSFPLIFEVKMSMCFPVSMTGTAMTWTAERGEDYHMPVVCEFFVGSQLCDFIWDECIVARDIKDGKR